MLSPLIYLTEPKYFQFCHIHNCDGDDYDAGPVKSLHIASNWTFCLLTKPSSGLWSILHKLPERFRDFIMWILAKPSIQTEAISQKLSVCLSLCVHAWVRLYACKYVCHCHHHPPVISTSSTLAVSQFNYIGTGRWAVPSMFTRSVQNCRVYTTHIVC